MKAKKEFIIGIVFIIGLMGLIVGFFFLKGQEVWKSRAEYYTIYKNSEGLTTGRPVNLNGLQVGIITNVAFVSATDKSVIVTFELNDPNLKSISFGSKMKLNSDLLSGPYLDIDWYDTTLFFTVGDTIPSAVSMALEDQINERLIPLEKKTNELISTADSAIKTIEAIFSRNTDNLDESFDGIKNAIRNFERVSIRVDTLIKNERFRISKILNNVASVTTNLKESNEEIANILKNVSEISDTLSKVDMVGTIENAKSSLEEVNAILYDVQHGDGTLTHLIQDSTLYHQVDDMILEATRLIENIKTYPKKYVHFSIFGKKDKRILDSHDEKTLKKFLQDSLN